MDAIETIQNRRSCRSYSSISVPVKTIIELIELSNQAPSPMTRQNRHFVIVTSHEKHHLLYEAAFKQNHVLSAPIVIVVVSPPGFLSPEEMIELCNKWNMNLWNATVQDYSENIIFMQHYRLWQTTWDVQDAAVAIETLLLAAESIGLGTCWVGGFDENAVKKALDLPPGSQVHALVTLGYKLEPPDFLRERKPVDEIVHFERW